MAATTVEHVLSAENLTGLVQGVVSGVPADLIPPGFMAATTTVEGNTATYNKVEGTRATARLVQYGAPSVKRELKGISKIPLSLMHAFEHQFHNPATLMNLQSEDSQQRQRMGQQTIARQVGEFGTLFRNLRLSAVHSILAKGAIYFDGDGNLLSSSSGAVVSVDFGVPAAHKTTLDVFGTGAILSASWATAATDIIGQIEALKVAALKKTGYPLTHAFYGSSIPGYLAGNTAIKGFWTASPMASEQALAGKVIPDGFLGLQWHPVAGAFADFSGTLSDWFGAAQITFTPEPSTDWWEVFEGTYPVPNGLNISADASAALAGLTPVAGAFSYAQLTTDPPGIKHLAGDTFIPALKVPTAVYIATVPTS